MILHPAGPICDLRYNERPSLSPASVAFILLSPQIQVLKDLIFNCQAYLKQNCSKGIPHPALIPYISIVTFFSETIFCSASSTR